ncbi:MAG: hypothetical protein KA184_13525 [Candidatus Hydrogenedentes bacterium]|nr:hypothetical protein [Candidatus Hydrogenedentota bacterium]
MPRVPGTYSLAAYVCVAVVLILGAVMPLLEKTDFGEYRPFLANITLLDDESVPTLVKVLLVYPAAAGVAVIIAAACASGAVRAVIVHLLGVAPFLAYYSDEAVRRSFGTPFDMPVSGNLFLPFGGAFALIGVVGLYAGGRIRRAFPAHRAGAIAASIGGAYFLLSLVVPLETPESGTYPLMAPFKLMFEDQGLWSMQLIGVSRLFIMLLLATASILALQSASACPDAALRARLLNRLWNAHFLLLLLAPCVVLVFVAFGKAGSGDLLGHLSYILKTAFTTLGMLFLLLMGAVDLIVIGADVRKAEG